MAMTEEMEMDILQQLAEIKVKLDLLSTEHPQCRGQITGLVEQVHVLSERVARSEQDIKSAHEKIAEFKKDVLWTISTSMAACSLVTGVVTFIVSHIVTK